MRISSGFISVLIEKSNYDQTVIEEKLISHLRKFVTHLESHRKIEEIFDHIPADISRNRGQHGLFYGYDTLFITEDE